MKSNSFKRMCTTLGYLGDVPSPFVMPALNGFTQHSIAELGDDSLFPTVKGNLRHTKGYFLDNTW